MGREQVPLPIGDHVPGFAEVRDAEFAAFREVTGAQFLKCREWRADSGLASTHDEAIEIRKDAVQLAGDEEAVHQKGLAQSVGTEGGSFPGAGELLRFYDVKRFIHEGEINLSQALESVKRILHPEEYRFTM